MRCLFWSRGNCGHEVEIWLVKNEVVCKSVFSIKISSVESAGAGAIEGAVLLDDHVSMRQVWLFFGDWDGAELFVLEPKLESEFTTRLLRFTCFAFSMA